MLGRRREKEDNTPPPAAAAAHPASPAVVAPSPHKRLGELLLEENLITRKQLEEACAVQEAEGGFLGHILVKLGFVTQNAVASCLVKQCKIPHLSLLDYDIGVEVLRLIPEEVCRKYHLLPIDKLGRILTVAMVDPLDLDALEEVRRACPDLRIKPILCNWEHFEMVSRRVFGRRGDDGGASVSMSSLGLSAGPSASAAPPAGAPAASRSPEAAIPPATNPETAEAAAPSDAGSDLAAIFRDSVRDAMRDFGKDLNAGAAPVTAAGVSAQDLAAVLRSSLQETVAAIVQELRQATPGAPLPAKAASADELQEIAQVVRDSVGGAIQEALAAMMVQMRAMAAADRADAAEARAMPSAQVLSDMLRDSVGGAIQEAMATLLVQLRAMGAGRHDGADASGGAIAEAIRAAQADTAARLMDVAETMRETLEANRAFQVSQEARMAELAEAAMQRMQQNAQIFEEIAVKDGRIRDMASAGPEARARHASVSPFGKPGAPPPEIRTDEDAQVLRALESEVPLETLTFDTFYPGAANAFTFKLSRAVAENPGGEYNPFFLYGNVGIGKTHLISAVGNAILARPLGGRVGYVSASHFSRRLSDAMRCDALDAFRENYCHWDVLILDDIQFMGGRVEAQEEFFHIFNVLHQQGRQIIIAGDKAPDRLGMLEQRLVSRFASGIVAELKAPEWETRMEILRHHVKQSGAKVPEEVLSLIAMRVSNDVRKMTGSLRKIVAFARLVGQEMSCEMAGEILSHLGAGEAA